jgi:hypothetical protein
MIDQLEMFSTGATRYAVNAVKREQHVHANSIKCYREDAAKICKRASDILHLLKCTEMQLTDRDIMRSLNFTDMNAVRPRITELIDAGLLRECGKVGDTLTGKTVRLVEVVK